MPYFKPGQQYFFYKPYIWMTGLAFLSFGSISLNRWQAGQQGKLFQDVRPSQEVIDYENKYVYRPGENRDAVNQVDFAPLTHSSWLKKE
ncbi:hypothetical protein FDP41_010800 [Naegleria fowleri]|uniref:Uncharacterized protein n=1 Tax=Naegleria fowleri TaxID=5763 RepID=A0A6A5C6T5_NAEFO|nr:uncharacterized protein FDP41_010800 [Naegleria fowleri]KAF0982821.1 hypothetical protein FDP41_010800 [Naegleria fowleri]CAG4713467.1 unnamed protein product [Naegleria fowleri]